MACYEIINCQTSSVEVINYTGPTLSPSDVIKPTPSIDPPNVSDDCWTVLSATPCESIVFIPISSVSVYNDCLSCQATPPPTCYQLTSCTGQILFTTENLNAYINQYVSSSLYPGECYYVAVSQIPCVDPDPFDGPTPCSCPCYTLTDCAGVIPPFNSTSNLSLYVGQVVQLDEYNNCNGPCFEVSLSQGPCSNPQNVTVSLGCAPCPPCNDCYVLVDCETKRPYLTLSNPTANAVDLSLIVGQVVSKVCLGPDQTECETGCWEILNAENCAGSVSAYVYDIVASCEICNAQCYKLTNCSTLDVIYVEYTEPNSILPNPSTLVGKTLGSLCFEAPTGCLTGCWQVELNDTGDCPTPYNWTTAVSYTEHVSCVDCLPTCYILTECVPSIAAPIIVNNDLSLYVGNVAKICNSQGECKCYSVEIAQTCDGAITLDNAIASFITCEECNSCDCPPGYTKIEDVCQKISSVPAIQNQVVYNVVPGSIDPAYGSLGTRFYSGVNNLPFPLTTVSGPDRFVDASSTNVPYTSNNVGVWSGPASSRLNTVGIWTDAAPNPLDEWIGFSQCIEITESGTYCVGIGGDNFVRLKIDGVLVAQTGLTFFSFNYWHVFEITLSAGTHVIVVEGLNTAGPAAFGAEIYNATVATLNGFTTTLQIQPVTIFTTFDKRTGDNVFETGENSGYSCPPGYTYSNCDGPACSRIETVPFVECTPSYLVKDCAGIQPDFITNTNLSAYLQGTYRACINTPAYNTFCFLLKDCNRLVPDTYTNTDLSNYLYSTVSLEEYPGSCFIVLPVPINQECIENPVTVNDQISCNCLGAQEPWPTGCYCITVEEIESTPAPDFTADISTSYNCCEDCLRVCYLLTDCQEALEPVVVCNDLANYVGKIIKITGCGETCWTVALADNCESNTIFGGDIIEFDTCEDCLPPSPPEPVLELHPRKIKPGYSSPNCKLTVEYIENVNCTFAKQVYDSMLVARYGITVCCENDLPLWVNRKAILDYELINDPSLCKSTLCYCPAPCLVDVVLELLPTCPVPTIVNTEIIIPCVAPVVTNVSIDYNPIPAPCECYTITPLEQPITISYLDCCCKVQTVLIDNLNVVSICASTAPAVFPQPSSATIVNNGACDEAGPCNPPICYCWKVTNPNPVVPGLAIFDNCPSGGRSTDVQAIVTDVPIYSCGFNPPSVTAGLIVENNGPCDDHCGEVPPVCQCYMISIDEPGKTCEFAYTNCDGVASFISVVSFIPVYICSQTLPAPECSGLLYHTETSSNPCQLDGTCNPCICYTVDISSTDGQGCSILHTPCGQPAVVTIFPDGVNYICSQTVPVSAVEGCTITVSSTSLSCQDCEPPI